MAGGVWAVVPVKGFARAKSRLRSVLAPDERTALARQLCRHVLEVVAASDALAGLLVVTDCAEVAAFAGALGAEPLADPTPAGRLDRVVDAALEQLAARGAAGALVLMADLPHLAGADVAQLLELMRRYEVVLAPDRADAGTNALGLRPPDRIGTRFGRPDSFAQHRRAAERSGLAVGIHRSPGVGFDIDSPADLAELRAIPAPTC